MKTTEWIPFFVGICIVIVGCWLIQFAFVFGCLVLCIGSMFLGNWVSRKDVQNDKETIG